MKLKQLINGIIFPHFLLNEILSGGHSRTSPPKKKSKTSHTA